MCRIHTLPKLHAQTYRDDNASRLLAETFRDFRLHALKTAPGAFAASYEEEYERGLGHTIERLAATKATHFVALSQSESESAPSIDDSDLKIYGLLGGAWQGMIVLLGPQDESSGAVTARADPFAGMTGVSNERRKDEAKSADQLHYHLNGMFVVPAARGSGLGRRLVERALWRAKMDTMRLRRDCVCTIIVDEWNVAARRLYERCGFVVVCRETYVQRPRGLVHGESRSEERIALRMELRISVGESHVL